MTPDNLTREEMIGILETIAREGSATARIQAIKVLLGLQDGKDLEGDELERLLRTK